MTKHQYLHLTHQIMELESRMRFDFRIIYIVMVVGLVTVGLIAASKR